MLSVRLSDITSVPKAGGAAARSANPKLKVCFVIIYLLQLSDTTSVSKAAGAAAKSVSLKVCFVVSSSWKT
jgi:hypothetical protein